jgi:predicted DNA binding CopG/RHH family protein
LSVTEPITYSPEEEQDVSDLAAELATFESFAYLVRLAIAQVTIKSKWLRAVKAKAWSEGAQAQAAAYGMTKDTGPNPYEAS